MSAETQAFLHAKDVFLLIFKRTVELPEGFHLMINNQPTPVNEYVLKSLRNQNLVQPGTLACKKGMEGWHPLSSVLPELIEAIISQ